MWFWGCKSTSFGIPQKLLLMQVLRQNKPLKAVIKRTGLCGKGALGDPGCAVFWLQHLGLHRGWRRAVLSAPTGKVVRLPTQIERVYPQSRHGHRAWFTVAGLPAAILRLPPGHERLHAEGMPPTCRRFARLLLRGPFLRVRTVTVLLGGATACVVKSPPRSHDSPESHWNTPAGTVRERRPLRRVQLTVMELSGGTLGYEGQGGWEWRSSASTNHNSWNVHARAQVAFRNKSSSELCFVSVNANLLDVVTVLR